MLLLDEGVVLRDTFQRQLVHQVDDVRLAQELVLELLHGDRERRRVEQDLPVGAHVADQLLDHGLELRREQFVRLIHHQHARRGQLGHALGGQVQQAPWCGDNGVDGLVQAHDVVAQRGAARRHHHLSAEVLSQLARDLRRLQGQLAGGHEDHGLDLVAGRVEPLEHRDAEGRGFSGPVLRAREDVAARERDRDRLLLDGRWPLEALFVDSHEELALEEVVLELVALGAGDVLFFGLFWFVQRRGRKEKRKKE